MDFPFTLPGYQNIPLVFRLEFIKTPAIIYNNKALPRKGKKFILPLSNGTELILVLKYFRDPEIILPRIEFQNQLIRVAPPLPVYQYIISFLPLVLMWGGGALGGALGFAAAYSNLFFFRDPGNSPPIKYVLAILSTIAAVVVWYAIALAIKTFL